MVKKFNAVLDLNCRPALQAMQTFTPNMIKNHWGQIVNITSRAVPMFIVFHDESLANK